MESYLAGDGKWNADFFFFARIAAYDEDEDGFTFSRTRSKKQKTTATTKKAAEPTPAPAPAKATKTAKAAALPAAEAQQLPAEEPPAKSARRTKKSLAGIAPAVADEIAPKRRRSARLSTGNEQPQQQQQQQQQQVSTPAPKRARKSAARKEKLQTPGRDNDDSMALVGGEAAEKAGAEQQSREGTKIALPFSDTPIIKRNKEMRKGGGGAGNRRSSTGLRGRRASSLIDSGTSNGGPHLPTPDSSEASNFLDNRADTVGDVAVPHAEVPVEEFYKHIEQSLPEPRRMKQLLTWCGTRALPDKPSGEVKDANAIMAG